jgi:hypothetical protein
MMNSNIDWHRIGLRDNPFLLTPPERPQEALWAGVPRLKLEFDRVLKEAKGSAATQVILCRGPVGGGKTHACVYYSLPERWPAQTPAVRDIHIWRVNTPKETGKPDRDFYINLLEYIGLDRVRPIVRAAIEAVGHETAEEVLRRTTESADLTRAILTLGEDPDNDLIDAFFLGKPTRTELRTLKLNRQLEKNQDYFRILAGIIKCYVGLSNDSAVKNHTRVCLWIDEMEDFVYFTPSQYRAFGQGIRELVDNLPNFFSLFLNFTLSTTEESEEIELILGSALVDRVTTEIFFEELTFEEMKQYVAAVLDHHRLPNHDNQGTQYFPFEESALELLLNSLPTRTPRDINKRCRNVLVRAFEDNVFENQASKISKTFVAKLKAEELDKEIG